MPSPGADTVHVGPYSYTINPDISDEPKFIELKAYWDAKRGARPMPTRAQLNPLEMRGHLGSLSLAEVLHDPFDIRWRLVGTNIVEAYGRDGTGKLASEFTGGMDADYQRWLLAGYRTVAERALIVRGNGPLKDVKREWRRFDVLLLPLDAGNGTVGMILAEQLFSS